MAYELCTWLIRLGYWPTLTVKLLLIAIHTLFLSSFLHLCMHTRKKKLHAPFFPNCCPGIQLQGYSPLKERILAGIYFYFFCNIYFIALNFEKFDG